MQDHHLSLRMLQNNTEFLERHIGFNSNERKSMLSSLGYSSMETLIQDTVPKGIRLKDPLDIPESRTEKAVLNELFNHANQNQVFRSLIGMGYHDTHTPSVILRGILENPGWYTAYTPYQPEVAQGRLEMLLNFQQMIMDLTRMEIANASLLDEASAAAEAMALCFRSAKGKKLTFLVSKNCHPQTIDVVKTRARPLKINVIVADPINFDERSDSIFGCLVQYPDTYGSLNKSKMLIKACQEKNIFVVVATDLLSLALVTPPGDLGVDVVVGNAQRFGVPLGFGGPHAAFFATKKKFKRLLPGRIIGLSIDKLGRPALRMALQTREQHIRRERATSNICTAQALLAIMASAYAIYHGPKGIKRIANRVHRFTKILALEIPKNGYSLVHQDFFDTLCVHTGIQSEEIIKKATEYQINLRILDKDTICIALDETVTSALINQLLEIFSSGSTEIPNFERLNADAATCQEVGIPANLRRNSPFLEHSVFNSYHTETEMMRYLKHLENKDIALNRSMIALGSCTMKLNAATEMIPITWPGFSGIHPFAPHDQVQGYHRLIVNLKQMLSKITGFDAVSLQPNAGAQGEYAGLLTILKFHESQGQGHRNICLIPSSAHGTNPASAQMAGLDIVIVNCDQKGNIDLVDLQAKAKQHSISLAAFMVTYPSTHGVFEENIVKICSIIHEYGGQVYMDGANLNALVGLAKPGTFGPDVMHINLHKTFCIPHGGGGPGMGPIAVKKHLAPFLPQHPVIEDAGPKSGIGSIAAAPWGSAGILPISYAYIILMGAKGLKEATEAAILNANYIAKRLEDYYPVLFTGTNGRVAHECIIDLRPIKEASGITEEDIAKRLIDYGFHAPTMSFPVPGTLMIEPTESESKSEIDRFCDSMISIYKEIQKVECLEFDPLDNPLKNAPHTAEELTASQWNHKYSREEAAYPLHPDRSKKYWPPIKRVNNVHGDRNLICSCPSTENYTK